jgi:hypothetical protein
VEDPARPEPIRLSATTRAWLYVRGPESVRILIDGTSVRIYGPGERVSHCTFTEEMDATLHQADLEHALIRDGWTLEQLTTERRAAAVRPRQPERRSNLRLVPDRDDSNK